MTALDLNACAVATSVSIDDIKACADIVGFARRYTKLERRGDQFWGRCPLHDDRSPSFKIDAQRQNFYCFGCRARGDVVELVMLAERLCLPDALERIQQIVGRVTFDPTVAAVRVASRAASAEREVHETERRKIRALTIWRQAEPLTLNAPELPVDYLIKRRGITAWNADRLRWHPACPWDSGTAGCVIAPVHDAQGDVTAIWRIRPAMDGKVERRGLGPMKTNATRLVDPSPGGPLAVAEGVEDALAVWLLTGLPAWAALSAGNMAMLELPKEHRDVAIFADADPVGCEAARTLGRRLQQDGRQVRVLMPATGKDPNAVLLARGHFQ